MKIVHLSDIHIWRLVANPVRLMSKRAWGYLELVSGRAKKFRLERIDAVVDRVLQLDADHILITGDLTTTSLEEEFRQAYRSLSPLLADPKRTTVLPGNHDRYTSHAMRGRVFERFFGEFSGQSYPWLKWIASDTAILGLDATRSHLSAKGRLPHAQLDMAKTLMRSLPERPGRLIVGCHYPLVAPHSYLEQLHSKRMANANEVAHWLKSIGPHLYCCGHVHAAWAFQPSTIPGQLCLNAGAPLLKDPTGQHPPGFLEIDLTNMAVSVVHHAWTGHEWSIFPMVQNLQFFGQVEDEYPPRG